MSVLFEQKTAATALTPPPVQEAELIKPTAPLSTYTEKFLGVYEEHFKRYLGSAELTIRVSDILGTIAHVYEKIRNTIEYKGERVLRRNAIERIMKRLLWERSSHDTEKIAQVLIRELIWARYLPNDTVPKSKIPEVGRIISKYLYFLGKLSVRGGSGISESELKSWVWGVASCEIEEALDPSYREPYVELMYDWFRDHFNWDSDKYSEHEKEVQIYLAIHRALTKSDEAIMRYHLLLKEVPTWQKATQQDMESLVNNFYRLHEEIEKHLDFSDRLILYRKIQRHVAPFEVLREMVQTEKSAIRLILTDAEKFEWKAREICARRYGQIQTKVNRGIIRSIVYIFVTKVLFALLIEVPYELYRFGALNYLPLGINVVVPPGMMFLIGLTIRAPGEDNTQRIITKLKSIVYEGPHGNSSFSLFKAKRGSLLVNIFAFIYLLLFILVFGGITYFLLKLDFTVLGLGVFFAFLSLVLLFGFRVRYTAQELNVTPDKESIFTYILNNLSLPFLRAGVYLSKGLAKLNFFTMIFDFLIEAPLKTIIEVFEEWTSFVREKREEVVEVPE